MKVFRLLCLLVIGICFLLPSVVYAAYDYYIPITVYNNDSSDWSGPVLVTLNHSQLVDLGYINSTALDTRLLEGSTDRLHMAADARLGLFIPSILGTQSRTYHYRLGEDPATITSFPVIVGDGGYVTVTDHANLELGDNFSIEFEGWVDTSETEAWNRMVHKRAAFVTYVPVAGSLSAAIISDTTITNVTLNMSGVGDETNLSKSSFGEPEPAYNWQCVSDGLDGTRVYTTSTASFVRDLYVKESLGINPKFTIRSVTAYFRVIKSTSGSVYAYPIFKIGGVVYNGTEQTGGTSYSTKSEVFTANPATGVSWTWRDIEDMQVGIALKGSNSYDSRCTSLYITVQYESGYTITKEVIASGLSSGEYTVNVWADGTDFGIDINGVTENTTALGGSSVPNNANNWVISIPYFNSYNHTVGANHRIKYEPTSYILGTTLPNRTSPGTYNGAITWGTNPATIDVTVGGMEPFSSPVAPGTGTSDEMPSIVPPPGSIDMGGASSAAGTGLPLQANFQRAADALDWSLPVTYTIMFVFVAIAFGVGAMVATGTVWGWVAGFGGTSALFGAVTDSTGSLVVPIWITILCVMFAIFSGYVWRYT